MRRAGFLLAVLVALAACSGDDGGSLPPTSTATSSATDETTTTVPEFTGDAGSPFCALVTAADDRPVLDPFEAGLEPQEVELRFRAMQIRFAEFAEVAPSELADDLADLVTALDDLDTALDAAGYDFASLAESGADLSAFDAPQFFETATRIDAYRTQVCGS